VTGTITTSPGITVLATTPNLSLSVAVGAAAGKTFVARFTI
jgi:hyaluronate lyase